MNSNLASIKYTIEEYEPLGMNGILIYCAELCVEPSNGYVYVEDIFFPDQPSETDMIPHAFVKALIVSIHADTKLMDKLYDASREMFYNTFDGFN